MSLLDLVPDGQTWDETVALAKALEAAGASIINTGIGWHEARVPTILTQVPRAAWAWTTERLRPELGIPVCASNRINTPEVAEEILADGTGRPGQHGPAVPRRPGVREQGRGRPRRRDQHLHRLQPGLPRPHVRQQARQLPGEPAGLPRDRRSCSPRPGARRRSRSSAPVRPGCPPPCPPPSAATRSRSSRPGPRSAASSASRCGSPARRSSPRRCATTPGGWRCSASTYASTPAPTSRPCRGTTTSSSPPASRRGPPSLRRDRPPEGRLLPRRHHRRRQGRAPRRRHRRRRHRRRRQPPAHPRRGRVARGLVRPLGRRRPRRRPRRPQGEEAARPGARGVPPPAQDDLDRQGPRQDLRLGAPRRAQGLRRHDGPRRQLRQGRRRRPAHHRRPDGEDGPAEQRVLDVDHVVVCAGQESVRGLYDDLVAAGVTAHLIGGRRRRRRARRQAGDRAGHPARRHPLTPPRPVGGAASTATQGAEGGAARVHVRVVPSTRVRCRA